MTIIRGTQSFVDHQLPISYTHTRSFLAALIHERESSLIPTKLGFYLFIYFLGLLPLLVSLGCTYLANPEAQCAQATNSVVAY